MRYSAEPKKYLHMECKCRGPMGCQVANTEQLNAGPGIDFKQIGWGSLTSTIFNRLHVFPFFGCSVLRDLLQSTT